MEENIVDDYEEILRYSEAMPELLKSLRLKYRGVRAVGIGSKFVGRKPTDPASLVVFVWIKYPLWMLRKSKRIPDTVELRKAGESVARVRTDIEPWFDRYLLTALGQRAINWYRSRTCDNRGYHDPLMGGHEIFPKSGQSGTLGYIVTHPQTNDAYILSCAHVLSGIGNIYPALHDIEAPDQNNRKSRKIAVLSDNMTDFNSAPPLKSDSALAKVNSGIGVSKYIAGLGAHSGVAPSWPSKNSILHAQGGVTCNAAATVRCVGVSRKIKGYQFANLILTQGRLGTHGDSGAPVFDRLNRIVGLLVAVNTRDSLICNIQDVIRDRKLKDWVW